MTRQTLVVIGNGMAGARAVEEVLARGGAEQFDIVMFGDEPYGNYNRILLSNILSGAQDAADIFINPIDWYEENQVKLYAGTRIVEIDRFANLKGSRTPALVVNGIYDEMIPIRNSYWLGENLPNESF